MSGRFAAILSRMDSTWGAQLAAALRSDLIEVSLSRQGYEPLEVAVDGDEVVLTFRLPRDAITYKVRFSADDLHRGASTGEPCGTPEEWAREVRMLLDEEVGTRSIHIAARTVESDGVVVLDL